MLDIDPLKALPSNVPYFVRCHRAAHSATAPHATAETGWHGRMAGSSKPEATGILIDFFCEPSVSTRVNLLT